MRDDSDIMASKTRKEATMPLQNRVDPFGEIHAVPQRGLFTGNRGVIHDPTTKSLHKRRWTTKAWIVCDLVHPRGVRREAMGRNAPSGNAGWTELFFLDEVTALAAGHRPCFYCRRTRAVDFAGRYADAFRVAGPSAAEIDAKLHCERLASGGPAQPLPRRDLAGLPDGSILDCGGQPYAIRAGRLLPWSFDGYGAPVAFDSLAGDVALLTPATTIAVLRAGYRPAWHPTALP